jgi:magnesium-transporting ATPase (P-type)
MTREVKEMGYFLERDSKSITLQTLASKEKYRVLKYLPFTSDRKASSIVVRD